MLLCDSLVSTIINIVVLLFLISVFVLVFFFPDKAGEIGAIIIKSFNTNILKGK
jgi:hypothetical protein